MPIGDKEAREIKDSLDNDTLAESCRKCCKHDWIERLVADRTALIKKIKRMKKVCKKSRDWHYQLRGGYDAACCVILEHIHNPGGE